MSTDAEGAASGRAPLMDDAVPALSRRRAVIILALAAAAAAFILFRLARTVLAGRPAAGDPDAADKLGAFKIQRAQLALALLALGLALVPPANRAMRRWLRSLRAITPRGRRILTATVFVLSLAYLLGTSRLQHRYLKPTMEDEFSYALQAQQIAHGRLWMPAPALPDFFDTACVIVEPVYASQYFPGAAILFAPAMWLRLPGFAIPALLCAGIVALTFRILAQVVDPAAALLAVPTLLCLSLFRVPGLMLLSQAPFAFIMLCALWAWLRWRERPVRQNVLFVGIFIGFAFITRPLDALCFALPIGLDMLLAAWRTSRKTFFKTLALGLAGMVPFASLQGVLNLGVTGSPAKTPFQLYASRDLPGLAFGFHAYDPGLRPASREPHKQAQYPDWVLPLMKEHQPGDFLKTLAGRAGMVVESTAPNPAVFALAPLALFALTRKRLVVVLPIALFIFLYTFYLFFLDHYLLVLLPALACVWATALAAFSAAARRLRPGLEPMLSLLLLGLCAGLLPEANRQVKDEVNWRTFSRIDDLIAQQVHGPAVVFFRDDPAQLTGPMLVHNFTSPDPDSAAVIRVHDLGQRNQALVDYYRAKQPDRRFYRYDQAADTLSELAPATVPQ